jgi:hypothetical protein
VDVDVGAWWCTCCAGGRAQPAGGARDAGCVDGRGAIRVAEGDPSAARQTGALPVAESA